MQSGKHRYRQFVNEGNANYDIPRHLPPSRSTRVTATPHHPSVTVITIASITKDVPQPDASTSPPSTCLALSIVTCCFCWPMAICAIVYSTEAARAVGAGDFPTARSKAKKAMYIGIGGIVAGLVLFITYVVLHAEVLNKSSY